MLNQLLVLRAERHRYYLDYMSSKKNVIGNDLYQEKLNAYHKSLNEYSRFKAITNFQRIITKGVTNTFKPFKSSRTFWDDLFFTHVNTAKEAALSFARIPKALWYLGKALNRARKKDDSAPHYAYYSLRTLIQLVLSIVKIILSPLMLIRALILRPIITWRSRKQGYDENEKLHEIANQKPNIKYRGRDRVYIAMALKHQWEKAKKHNLKNFLRVNEKQIIEKLNLEQCTVSFDGTQEKLRSKDNALLSHVSKSPTKYDFAAMFENDFDNYQGFFREKIAEGEDKLRNYEGIIKKRN